MLSIIIPVFNHIDLTQQAIKNVEETTHIPYELIIVNDGSKDDTEKRLKDNKKDNRIIINQENQGTNGAWNVGVENAKGDYIAVLNNDIIMPDNTLEDMIEGFTDDIWMINPRSTSVAIKGYGKKPFYFANHIQGWCWIITKEAKKALFPIDKRLKIFGGDNWLFFKMLYLGKKLKIKHNVIVHHLESQTVDVTKNFDRPVFLGIAKEEGRYIEPVDLKNFDIKEDLVFGL